MPVRIEGGTYNDEKGAKANKDCADDGHNPVHFIVGRPAVNEQAHTHQGAEPDHQHQAILGPWPLYAVGLHTSCLDTIIQCAKKKHACDQRDSQAQVHKPRHGRAKPVLTLEHAGEGGKQKVHKPKD